MLMDPGKLCAPQVPAFDRNDCASLRLTYTKFLFDASTQRAPNTARASRQRACKFVYLHHKLSRSTEPLSTAVLLHGARVRVRAVEDIYDSPLPSASCLAGRLGRLRTISRANIGEILTSPNKCAIILFFAHLQREVIAFETLGSLNEHSV